MLQGALLGIAAELTVGAPVGSGVPPGILGGAAGFAAGSGLVCSGGRDS
jgi:hypothetical protein